MQGQRLFGWHRLLVEPYEHQDSCGKPQGDCHDEGFIDEEHFLWGFSKVAVIYEIKVAEQAV